MLEINILQAILGAVVGLVLGLCFRSYSEYNNNRTVPKKYHKLLAQNWQHHYYNVDQEGNTKFYSDETWQIKKRRLRNKFTVKVVSALNNTQYVGYVEYEPGFLLFDLRDPDERLFMRCSLANVNENTRAPILLSLGSARDFRNRPSANATVLSHRQLTEQEFLKVITENFILHEKERLVTGK